MLRAFSSRKSSLGYDRVGEEESGSGDADALAEPTMLTRARSVPARILFGLSKKPAEKPNLPPPRNSAHKGKNKKSHHPLFSIFEGRWRKKKMTAKPEVARYMDYLKEGGRWDKETDTPVIHYNN